MELRKAKANEAEICYQCIEDARAYHKSLGFEQWRPDYPTRETILEDIAQNMGYTFVDEQGIIGYCCIIIGDEPAYRQIEGAWKTNRPYAVVHRMAFNKKARGGGRSKEAFDLIKELCLAKNIHAIRVDTQDENKVMQHILVREGFAYCGLIQFGGGPKLAYEWDNELPVYRGDGKASRASGRSVRFLKKKMDFVEKGGKKIDLLPPFS